ncbi:MAG: MarR family winged helix-turn-helix transcriptional regulator [Alphaproteobacteria bacterium]
MKEDGQKRPRRRRRSGANGTRAGRSMRGSQGQDNSSSGSPTHFTDWGDLVAVKVIQIAEIISRSASQVYEAGYGIRNSELRILLLLGSGERLSVNEISRRAGIDKAWISRSLDVMMKADLIKRVPHPSDSRKSLISLTEKGERSLQTITPIALTRDKHILAGLDKEEIHKVLDTLRARAQQLLLPELEKRPSRTQKTRSERVRSEQSLK